MTKKDLIEHLRRRLATDPRWALRALIRIYQNPTTDEQSKDAAIERNGIGFFGPDAEILSSFARQYLRCRSLSPKQMNLLQRKIPSYARQILQCSDAAILAAAFELGCPTLYTEDLNHGQTFESIQVINPFV